LISTAFIDRYVGAGRLDWGAAEENPSPQRAQRKSWFAEIKTRNQNPTLNVAAQRNVKIPHHRGHRGKSESLTTEDTEEHRGKSESLTTEDTEEHRGRSTSLTTEEHRGTSKSLTTEDTEEHRGRSKSLTTEDTEEHRGKSESLTTEDTERHREKSKSPTSLNGRGKGGATV
jgi:hypothetical protein